MTDGSLTKHEMFDGKLESSLLSRLDWSQLMDQDGYGINAIDMAMTTNHVLILTRGSTELRRNLLVFDIATGKCRAKNETSIQAIASYIDGTVLLASYEPTELDKGCEIAVYDPQSEESRSLFIAKKVTPKHLSFDPESKRIFFEQNGLIYEIDDKGNEKAVCRIKTGINSISSFVVLGELCLYINEHGLCVVPIISEGIQPIRLVFSGYCSINSDDNPVFSLLYPEVIVQYRDYPLTTDFVQQILTKDDAADIYTFSASSPTYRALVAKGYAADLSNSSIIQEQIEQMYPQFSQKLKSKEGHIVSIPMGGIYSPTLYSYSVKAFENAQITDVPTTIFQYMDMIRTLAARDDLLEQGYRLTSTMVDYFVKREVLQAVLQAYIGHCEQQGQRLRLDTMLFRELLTDFEHTIPAIESLCNQALSFYGTEFDGDDLMERTLFTSPGADPLPESNWSPAATQYLPLVISDGETPIIDVDMTVFIVNAASPNKELAIEYLECYIDNMSAQNRIMFYPDACEPVLLDYYHDDRAFLLAEREELEEVLAITTPDMQGTIKQLLINNENELKNLESRKWLITEEAISQYKDFVPHMRIYDNKGLNFFMGNSFEIMSILNQYLDGAIDMEGFIRRYDQLVYMIEAEGQ